MIVGSFGTLHKYTSFFALCGIHATSLASPTVLPRHPTAAVSRSLRFQAPADCVLSSERRFKTHGSCRLSCCVVHSWNIPNRFADIARHPVTRLWWKQVNLMKWEGSEWRGPGSDRNEEPPQTRALRWTTAASHSTGGGGKRWSREQIPQRQSEGGLTDLDEPPLRAWKQLLRLAVAQHWCHTPKMF